MEEQEVKHSFRIAGLITKYINDGLNESHLEELMEWVNDCPENSALFKKLSSLEEHQSYLSILKAFPASNALVKVKKKINPVQLTAYRTKNWWLYVSAAAIILLISIATWFISHHQKNKEEQLLYTTTNISPGRDAVLLTLSNGKKIALDSVSNGQFAEQNGISISKTKNGNLIYQISKVNSYRVKNQFNTLETPRGCTYQVNLPDGTKVWLNATSSLRFPVSFSSYERRVELSGEGYFEVAKDKIKPFFVKTDQQEIKVLGTHFNVDAYVDNDRTQTTLLEGAVQVSGIQNLQKGQHIMLKPGERSILNSGKITVTAANIKEDIAWKDGHFLFDNMPLRNILKQLNRWYNINIDYSSVPDLGFTGYISRDERLYRVLHMLELTGNVKFKIENNTLKATMRK